jgi:hypothetical protein
MSMVAFKLILGFLIIFATLAIGAWRWWKSGLRIPPVIHVLAVVGFLVACAMIWTDISINDFRLSRAAIELVMLPGVAYAALLLATRRLRDLREVEQDPDAHADTRPGGTRVRGQDPEAAASAMGGGRLPRTRLSRFLGRPFDFSDPEAGRSRRNSAQWATIVTIGVILSSVTRRYRLPAPLTLDKTLRLLSFEFLTCSCSFYLLMWVVELTRPWRSRMARYVVRSCCGACLIFAAGASFGPIVGLHASLDVAIRWIPGLLLVGALLGAILSMLDDEKDRQADP